MRKIVSRIILAGVLFTGTLPLHAAGDNDKPARKGSASTAEVSYLGSLDGEPMFHVVYNNSTRARFSIRLLDADGHQLYQGFFTDKKFDKKFRIATTELSGRIVFVLRNFQDNSVQNFQVETDTRVVEDVDVKEVQ